MLVLCLCACALRVPVRGQVAAVAEKWREAFHVTISFAAGSPARVTAIQAALRPYKHQFIHLWQKKTFWDHAMVSRVLRCFWEGTGMDGVTARLGSTKFEDYLTLQFRFFLI